MNKDKLDEFWTIIKHVGSHNRLEEIDMVVLGSVFGEMETEILRLQDELEVK